MVGAVSDRSIYLRADGKPESTGQARSAAKADAPVRRSNNGRQPPVTRSPVPSHPNDRHDSSHYFTIDELRIGATGTQWLAIVAFASAPPAIARHG